MSLAFLAERGVVEVSGLDAPALLQRLLTNDVAHLEPSTARYAALLTPQGKIVVDFLVVAKGAAEDGFYLDCPVALAADLARKLTLYRLRANVAIADRSEALGVAAAWPSPPAIDALIYRDPRHEALGYRAIAPRQALAAASASTGSETAYKAHRIAAGVPEGGADFAYGDTFPHEANLDRLHGLDFTKGCYVGQEVVSRVEHRGTARKRVLPVVFEGQPPSPGAEVVVGEIAIGTMGSAIDGRGLALVRTDRAGEAAATGAIASANGVHLSIGLG